MGKVLDKVKEFKSKYGNGLCFRINKHIEIIESYLDPDEDVLLAFGGQKNESFLEVFNSFVFALTTKRIILGRKRLMWGSFMYSVTPDLYNDMQIYRGLIWGKITIDTVKEQITFSNLPKNSLDEIETVVSNFMMDAKKEYKNKDK